MSSYYTGRAPPRSRYSVPSGTGSSSSTSAYGSDWSSNPGSGSGSSSSSRYTPKSYTPTSYGHGHSSYDRSGSGTSSPSPNPYSSATKGSTATSYLNSYSSLPRSYVSPSRRDTGGSAGLRNYGSSGSPTSSTSTSASSKSSSYYPSPSSVTGSYLLGHYSVGPVVQTTSALQAYYTRQAAAANANKGATPTSTSTAGSTSASASAGSGGSAAGNRDRDRDQNRPYSNTGLSGSNSFGAYDLKSRRRAPSPEYIQTKERQIQNREGAYVQRGITPGPGSVTGRQNCDVVLTNKNNNNSNTNNNNLNSSSKSGLASHRTSRTDINQVPPVPATPPTNNNSNNNTGSNNEKKQYKKSLSKRLSASLSSLAFSIGSVGSRSLSNSKLSSPSTENLDHGEFDDDSYSDSVGSGKVSELSYDYNQGAVDSNSISNNDASSRTNYRKLYEGIFKENELLKSCLTRYEKQVDQLKFKLSRLYDQQAAHTPPPKTSATEKKDKRTLEMKMEAMEIELRQMQKLKLENENIRAENRALTRVVSKLSSKGSS